MATAQTQRITAENVIHLFPEVDSHLADSHRVPTDENDLHTAGYDEEQIRLMEEVYVSSKEFGLRAY